MADKLTPEQKDLFDSKHFATIATINPDGQPQLSIVWCAIDGDEILVVGSCPAHLQAASELGAQLHMVCTGRSAHLDPLQPLPPGWPPGTRAHASLGALVDYLLPQVEAGLPAAL